MKYGECEERVKNIVSEILNEAVEEESIAFADDIERGVIQKKLTSDIALFIFKYFGLEGDKS